MSSDPSSELQRARESRIDAALDEVIDRSLGVVFSEADTVGPRQRHQLRGLLRHYAKMKHPFDACVRDNTKRFGPGRVEKVCAVLKDIIRGTTKWRGHPSLDHGAPGAVAASDAPEIDQELGELLLSLSEEDLYGMIFAAAEKVEEAVHA